MKLGFQLSSLKPLLTSAQGVRDAFSRLADIGYKTLQIQWIDPSVPDEAVRDALLEMRLQCVSTQDYFEIVEANVERVYNQCRLWGAKLVTVSGIPSELMTLEGIRAYIKRLLILYAKLADAGLRLTFHPRAKEFEEIGGVPAVDWVMDALPFEAQMTLDFYHVRKAGLDPCEAARAYAGRMDMAHFKNGALGSDGKEELVPLGQGDFDWKPVIAACKKANVKWGFAEQETWSGDPYEAMRESYAYLTRLGVK